jgi:hypothetical protein
MHGAISAQKTKQSIYMAGIKVQIIHAQIELCMIRHVLRRFYRPGMVSTAVVLRDNTHWLMLPEIQSRSLAPINFDSEYINWWLSTY